MRIKIKIKMIEIKIKIKRSLVHTYWKRKVESSASVARMKAALNKSGTRNRRSLALVVSTSTTAPARASSLATNQKSDRPKEAAVKCVGMPTGKKTFTSKAISTNCLTEALHSMRAR